MIDEARNGLVDPFPNATDVRPRCMKHDNPPSVFEAFQGFPGAGTQRPDVLIARHVCVANW